MLTKRVIVCLDVRNGKTTKGVRFLANILGDPVEMAAGYYETGVDELVFYDITASHERRGIMINVVRRVAEQISFRFRSAAACGSAVDDMRQALLAGADKVSVDSGAVRNPATHCRRRKGLRQPVHRSGHAGASGRQTPRHSERLRGIVH